MDGGSVVANYVDIFPSLAHLSNFPQKTEKKLSKWAAKINFALDPCRAIIGPISGGNVVRILHHVGQVHDG